MVCRFEYHRMQKGCQWQAFAEFRNEQGKVLMYLSDRVLECEIVECRRSEERRVGKECL